MNSLDNVMQHSVFLSRRRVLALSAVFTACGIGSVFNSAVASSAHEVPAPLNDVAEKADSKLEVAVLAGGCFWGVQGVYQHVMGVISAESGYAGGEMSTARYDLITRGKTGHAESVRITYDPRRISYGRILQIFFSVVHDPTQLNRQGPDIGTHYRSAIFPQDMEQASVAKEYIAQLNRARVFQAAIVTKIESERPFYPAEEYHQDYMFKNPMQPYIVFHDKPKIEDLKRVFPDRFRADPALMATARK